MHWLCVFVCCVLASVQHPFSSVVPWFVRFRCIKWALRELCCSRWQRLLIFFLSLRLWLASSKLQPICGSHALYPAINSVWENVYGVTNTHFMMAQAFSTLSAILRKQTHTHSHSISLAGVCCVEMTLWSLYYHDESLGVHVIKSFWEKFRWKKS